MKKMVAKKIMPVALSAAFLMGSFLTTNVSAAELPAWDFSKDAGGWVSGGVWNYDGAPTISYDEKFGGGALKLDVDFHKKFKESWSEVKLHDSSASADSPLVLDGCDLLTFDFYYNPKNQTNGSFKTKIYMKSDAGVEVVNVNPDISLVAAQTVAGTDLKKVKVLVPFKAVSANVVYFDFSVVGSYTNYKGEIYIDNIELKKRD